MPRVSVVTRCYRQAHFLPAAAEAVLAQTFADWELVIVNDGSPDDTSEVARGLARSHPGRTIRLVEQENAGPAAALNSGVGAARGDLVLPLDADDLIHPAFLERTVAALDGDPKADVALTDVVLFGAQIGLWHMGPFSLEALRQRNRLCITSLFRREAWTRAGGFNLNTEIGYEDWDFWIACAERGSLAVHVRQPLFFYRMHAGAETTNAVAMKHHAQLVARVVLNHPAVFGEQAVASATALLRQRPLPRRPRA